MTISIACASCRFPNAPGAKFCRQCGAALAASIAPSPSTPAIACPGCAQPVDRTQKFCRACGHQLAASSPAPQDIVAVVQPTAAVIAPQPSEPPVPPLPLRPRPGYASARPTITRVRRRKIWPWAVAGGFLAAIGITGWLVYEGKLTLPTAAQRLVQEYVPVRAPEIRVGDTNTYEISLAWADRSKAEDEVTLESRLATIAGDGSEIYDLALFQKRLAGKRITGRVSYNRNLNEFEYDRDNDDAAEFALQFNNDPTGVLERKHAFPLRSGKMWHDDFNVTIKENGKETDIRKINVKVMGQVLGWERAIGRLDGVMVDGLKLRAETVTRYFEDDGIRRYDDERTTVLSTAWYVPAAGRSVVIRSTLHVADDDDDTRGRLIRTSTQRLENFIPTDLTDTE